MMDAPQAERSRLHSLDVLRGLVIFLMIFVNDAAGAPHTPAWLKHFHPYDADGMTIADIVFPAFLFMVGTSIPLSVDARRRRGAGAFSIAGHALARTLGLLLLGVTMVNMPANAAAMGWPRHLWEVLAYAAAIVAFSALPWPRAPAGAAARLAALAGLLLLLGVYRDAAGAGVRPHWWGILGLIGWAYATGFAYHALIGGWRGARSAALAGGVALLLSLWLADRAGLFSGWWIDRWVDLGSMIGSQGSVVLAGALLGDRLVRGPPDDSPRRRAGFALGWAALLACGAILMDPLHGINKNAATPAWCLWSSAITLATWAALHPCIDRPGARLAMLRDAGQNPLLPYLLQPMLYQVLALAGLTWHGWLGRQGVAGSLGRAALVAGALVAVAAIARRRGWVLRL